MKLTITRPALLRCLRSVESVTERKATVPILANVFAEARNGQLRLTATDMEIAVTNTAAATIDEEGATTLPARTLLDMVGKLPDDTSISITTDSAAERATVVAGRFRTDLTTLPTEDFPSMTTAINGTAFDIPTAALRKLIDRTRAAMSTDSTRYYLCGMYLSAQPTDSNLVLRAVTTDGHRLAQADVDAPPELTSEKMPGIIVPRRSVLELRKLLDGDVANVRLTISDSRFCAAVDDAVLTTKLVDGTFPDYERVIPPPSQSILQLDRAEITGAIARVSAIGSDRTKPVTIEVDPGSIVLSAHSTDSGSATEEIESNKASATHIAAGYRIGFQSRYLVDCIDQVLGRVVMHLGDEQSPVLVRDTDQPNCQWVIMPYRA